MNIPWLVPEVFEDHVVESLRDPDFFSNETLDYLQSNRHEVCAYFFELWSRAAGRCGMGVKVSFNLLLEAGNVRAIKAFIKEGDHYDLALLCSESVRVAAARYKRLSRIGWTNNEDEAWPNYLDYIYRFFSECVQKPLDEDDDWELTPAAQAVADYVRSQIEILDDVSEAVCSAYTKDGRELHSSGRDEVLEMYKAIYEELTK